MCADSMHVSLAAYLVGRYLYIAFYWEMCHYIYKVLQRNEIIEYRKVQLCNL